MFSRLFSTKKNNNTQHDKLTELSKNMSKTLEEIVNITNEISVANGLQPITIEKDTKNKVKNYRSFAEMSKNIIKDTNEVIAITNELAAANRDKAKLVNEQILNETLFNKELKENLNKITGEMIDINEGLVDIYTKHPNDKIKDSIAVNQSTIHNTIALTESL